MCFSTAASFASSAVLAVIGVASVKNVETKSQLLFACIPFLFSLQQLTEGFVWFTMLNPEYLYLQHIAIHIFIIFAQVVWTIYVPLSFYVMEKNAQRKKALRILVAIGIVPSVYISYCLFFYPISATIMPYHIHYNIDFPNLQASILGLFYFLPIILPSLISSVRRTSILGILLLVSFLFTKLYYNDYVISVWCFFSALISGLVVLILYELRIESKSNFVYKGNLISR